MTGIDPRSPQNQASQNQGGGTAVLDQPQAAGAIRERSGARLGQAPPDTEYTRKSRTLCFKLSAEGHTAGQLTDRVNRFLADCKVEYPTARVAAVANTIMLCRSLQYTDQDGMLQINAWFDSQGQTWVQVNHDMIYPLAGN